MFRTRGFHQSPVSLFLPPPVILNGSEFKLELKTCFATLCSGTCLSSAAMSTLLTKDQLPSVATDAIPTHTLDMVSRSNLRAFLRNLQSTTSPGGSVLLAFSTLSAPLSFSSAAYILVAIPFLPHNPVKKEITSSLNNHSHRPLSERRTLLPVQTSLDQIIRELTSGPAAFNIEFVHDASVVHAIDLNKRIQELETDIYSRKAFIAKWGLGTWREERFLIAWETALIAAGLLTRWVVLVRR